MSILNLQGVHENELAATGEFNPQAPKTALMLPSGQRVVLPTELLLHALAAPGSSASSEIAPQYGAVPVAPITPSASLANAQDDTVIPLVAEHLEVGTRQVETGRVRVRRATQEHTETVQVALTDVRWEIDHVPMEQKIETAPEIRHAGDTIIFPMVEERMVVSRELWLREEIHVRRVKTVVEKSADFPVRRDILIEERSTPGQSTTSEAAS